jgi:hypothetical protein
MDTFIPTLLNFMDTSSVSNFKRDERLSKNISTPPVQNQ